MIVMPRRAEFMDCLRGDASHGFCLRRSIHEVSRTGATHSPSGPRQRSRIAIRLADRPAPGSLPATSTASSESGSDCRAVGESVNRAAKFGRHFIEGIRRDSLHQVAHLDERALPAVRRPALDARQTRAP